MHNMKIFQVRATQAQEKAKTGLRAVQYMPGSIYNANRAAAFVYVILNCFKCAQQKPKKKMKPGMRALQYVPGLIYSANHATALVYAI